MSRKTSVELTNLCLISDGDKILIQERDYHGKLYYVLPGGHVEDGESIMDSIVREIQEETGLALLDVEPCGFKNWIDQNNERYLVLLFKATKFTGTLTSSDEGRVFWTTREEYFQMDTIWNMVDMVKMIDEGKKHEIYFPQNSDFVLK